MALNRVGGDIWMEELSQKNRNVLRPVCLAGRCGKEMPGIRVVSGGFLHSACNYASSFLTQGSLKSS